MKEIRVFTGCYDNCKNGNLDNIGKIDEDENNKYYMYEFYKQVLSNLDAKEVLNELQVFGEYVILLCFEKENEFCDRHLVATWLERCLKIEVKEVCVTDDGIFKFLERNQKYVKQFNEVVDVYMNKRKE